MLRRALLSCGFRIYLHSLELRHLSLIMSFVSIFIFSFPFLILCVSSLPILFFIQYIIYFILFGFFKWQVDRFIIFTTFFFLIHFLLNSYYIPSTFFFFFFSLPLSIGFHYRSLSNLLLWMLNLFLLFIWINIFFALL